MATLFDSNVQRCDVGTVQAAIFDQRKLIEYIVNEDLETRPFYMINKIMDGGEVDPHDDGRTLIMGRGFQAPVGYSDDNDPFPAQSDNGTFIQEFQEAQEECGYTTARIGALVNETEQDACNGVCVVDFAQGHRTRTSDDFDLNLATPERCMEVLAKKERKFVAQYLEQEAESFAETAFQSFDHHLVNLAINRGEANAVVKSVFSGNSSLPILTGGGWQIGNDPKSEIKHVTFWFFEQYRRQIVQRLRQFGKGRDSENFIPDFEITRDAYREMMINESLERTGDGGFIAGRGGQVRIDGEALYEKSHKMYGRAYALSPDGKCRFIFNDEPIRGFLRPQGATPAGDTIWEFIRIYHLKNVPDEDAGVRAVYNPEYDYTEVRCEGVDYPLMELIPHIHEDSFTRHGLTRAIGPAGVETVGTNFEIQLLTRDALSSSANPNFFKNKYRYAARHKMRWRDVYPELSGFIMHRRRILRGYDIEPNDEVFVVKDGTSSAAPDVIENCNEERADNGCPEIICDPATNSVAIEPCGSVETSYCGESHLLTIIVRRSDECPTEAATATYGIADDTAILGTHYQPVDGDGNVASPSGTLTWEPGDFGPREICIRIDGALADTAAPPVTGPCCEETFATPNPALFSIKVDSVTGTTIGDCDEVIVAINNRA